MKRMLLLIIFAAFLLRVIGLGYGLPMQFVGDEASLVGGALKMLELRTFIPALNPEEFRLLYYPPLIPYLYVLGMAPVLAVKLVTVQGSMELLQQAIVLDPTPVWIASRFVNALLGTGLVLLTFVIGRKIFGDLAGIFAAAWVGVSFLAVQLSHFARHWMPATFFTYFIVAFGILIYLQAGKRAYLWAGYAAGVAFSASFITAIGLFVPGLAHVLGYGKAAFRWEHLKNLVVMGAVSAVIGGIGAALNYPEFQRIVFGEDSSLQAAKSFSGLLISLKDSAGAFFSFEPLLASFALIGLLILALTSWRLFLLFAGFPLVYWIVLYFFFHFEPRYNVLLVPWSALLASVAAVQLWNVPLYRTLGRLAVLVGLLVPLIVSGYYDYLLLQPDSRTRARDWIERHIPPNTTVALYAGTLDILPNHRAIQRRLEQYPYTIRTRDRILQKLPASDYPTPTYEVLNVRQLQSSDQEEVANALASGAFSYLVVERFEGEQLPPFITHLLDRRPVVASFTSSSKPVDVNGNFPSSVFGLFSYRNLGPEVIIVSL